MTYLFRILVIFAALACTRALEAQLVHGTVEDSVGMPLDNVAVSLIPASGDSVLRSVRTGNAGEFSIPVPRAGRYRLRLNRIGYSQQTSEIMDFKASEIVTLRFVMSATVQSLATVEILERRGVKLTELMSASGFDLRRNRYPMNAMDADRLAEEGTASLEDIFLSRVFNAVEIVTDSFGTSIRMAQLARPSLTRGYCFPEVHLDGFLLSDGNPNTAASALMILSGLGANQTYGIEVYRERELPPPGLGGMLGASGETFRPCGVVAVWTKAGRESALIRQRMGAEGPVQVIRGKVVDFATGTPIANATVTLKSEFGADLEPTVVSDSAGSFSIRTKHSDRLRLSTSGTTHVPLTTPPFRVDLEEMVTVEVIIAPDRVPLAPLALISRELARNYSATSPSGFSFRRRRGLGGVFFDSTEIARSGASSLTQLASGLPGVVVGDPGGELGGGASLLFLRAVTAPAGQDNRRGGQAAGRGSLPGTQETGSTCTPMYFLNGELQREPRERIHSIPLSEIHGIEIYTQQSEVPYVYRVGSTGCGMIGVWVR